MMTKEQAQIEKLQAENSILTGRLARAEGHPCQSDNEFVQEGYSIQVHAEAMRDHKTMVGF